MENATNDMDFEDEYIFDNPKVRIVFITLYTIVFFFSVFGNLAVVLVISIHWKMRGSTKFCLANLAFANCCVGAFCVYQDLSMYLIDNWIFGKFLCKMYHFVTSLAHTASILILVVIAVERYFAIQYPLKIRRILTMRRLKVIILLVWTVSGLICSPRLYFFSTVRNAVPGMGEGEPKKPEVICTLISRIYNNNTSDLIHFILLFLTPLSTISILYGKIGVILRRREDFVSSCDQPLTAISEVDSKEKVFTRVNTPSLNHTSGSSKNRKVSFMCKIPGDNCQVKNEYCESEGAECDGMFCKHDLKTPEGSYDSSKVAAGASGESSKSSRELPLARRRSRARSMVENSHKGVVRMLIAIVVSFAICNLPFHLRKLYQHFFPKTDNVWTELATPLSFLLMFANCAINPILYAFMSKNFRCCFLDCVRCQLKRPTQVR